MEGRRDVEPREERRLEGGWGVGSKGAKIETGPLLDRDCCGMYALRGMVGLRKGEA
jgi:hypothetical protein